MDSVRDSDAHLGLAHWGCVRIVSSVKIELTQNCYDVVFGSRRSNESRGDLFVGLGNGHLFHGSVHADHKPSPRFYKAELDSHVSVRSLAFCPFGEQFILAGSDDGSVRIEFVVCTVCTIWCKLVCIRANTAGVVKYQVFAILVIKFSGFKIIK